MVTYLDLELGRRTFTLCPSTQFDIFTLGTYFYALIKKMLKKHTLRLQWEPNFLFSKTIIYIPFSLSLRYQLTVKTSGKLLNPLDSTISFER